jgi:acetate kinase
MKILVANVGSTSFKFKLYSMDDEAILSQGKIENIGAERSAFSMSSAGKKQEGSAHFPTYENAVDAAIRFLTEGEHRPVRTLDEIDAVGFKTVHGKGIRECRLLDDAVLQAMEEYNFLAPAHNPPYIKAIRIFAKLIPQVPRVGLFEPAFHRHIPDHAFTYGLPYELAQKHQIRKYGFHGASHRWISEKAPQLLKRPYNSLRIISCHLGGSSSICAIKNGRSLDVSMGFSPQSGVLNAKRCGDLDPFIPLYLQEQEKWSAKQVSDLLNSQSGLAGISGIASGDMKHIIDSAELGNERARLAIAAFCYGVQHYIGAYYVALQGLDVLAFTGGMGERGVLIRQKVCEGLQCLGVMLDQQANANAVGDAVISTGDSQVSVVVIPANEELIVAREVKELLRQN